MEVVVALLDFENDTVSEIVGLLEVVDEKEFVDVGVTDKDGLVDGVFDTVGVLLGDEPRESVAVGVELNVGEDDCDGVIEKEGVIERVSDRVDVGDGVGEGVDCGVSDLETLGDEESEIEGVWDDV